MRSLNKEEFKTNYYNNCFTINFNNDYNEKIKLNLPVINAGCCIHQ